MGTDIGHVHLEVSNLRATTHFYVDGLGLDLMAEYGDQAGFFASRGYHHHLGTNTWHSLGRPQASKEHAGLERIVFAVENEGELTTTHDRLGTIDHPAELNGQTLIVKDPDGIELVFDAA